MKIKHGGTRTAFLFAGYAIKVPHIRIVFDCILFFLVYKFGFTEKMRRLAENEFNYCFRVISNGVWGNKEECRTYKETKANFIAKSYSTLFWGFILFQKRVIGEPIWFDDVKLLLKQLPEDQYDLVLTKTFDVHSLSNGDWVKTPTGVVICDYGGKGVGNTSLFSFLVNNKEDLERILKA